ncbi:hypothetical protein IFM89_028430 [Coptis chinensis]|uniref:Receptor-like serine/threonine-protein kinase n=1 Tax=Coptis chinensis TaxID=261450 RepID=A0A835IT76_9MAGN|nr:hypothetical protein IFM89_028430 [Coptis chinensis]
MSCSTNQAEYFFQPIAENPNSWTNNLAIGPSLKFIDGSMVRLIHSQPTGSNAPRLGFGFYCNGNCTYFLLAVFMYSQGRDSKAPQVIWSSDRNNPVRENSTLEFTREGDLVLRNVDGRYAWSTSTSGRSVVGVKLTEVGNLALYDRRNSTIWQSSDHPTDALVLGQKLVEGQMLRASVSALDWTEGLYSVSVNASGLVASIQSNPPVPYFESIVSGKKKSKTPSYMKYLNGSLALYILNAKPDTPDRRLPVPLASSSIQFLKFGPDGHLKVYDRLNVVADLLTIQYYGDCGYPLFCGSYGICSSGQCSCSDLASNGTSYFSPVDERQPNLGCRRITPLSCEPHDSHDLLELKEITYFSLTGGIKDTDIESCKQTCLSNCSCKAAFFKIHQNDSHGECFMQSDIFSLIDQRKHGDNYKRYAFIKVQNIKQNAFVPPPAVDVTPPGRTWKFIIIASLCVTIFSLVFISYITMKKSVLGEDERYLDQLPGIPTRFSYKDLKAATGNFCTKLGQGGFGSVYEGALSNSTKVAVKRLEGIGNIKKSFLAEVETIGSIHHVNLVSLIGFCADKSHRLLVYEYMCNGSLDKWIFCEKQDAGLDWKTRKKIVLDIAKGLSYLHEECKQRIVHLDIKPQNILLDNKFNAKVSDFGLSRLMNRDESKFMTTMRGTFGYLAPEWLSSVITEKVDVFSFGIVVLEILCGRPNLDFTQPEAERCGQLLNLLERKAKEDRLHDMINEKCVDLQLHREEVVDMLKVAEWCLQRDYSERPSMSVVVKILEGVLDIRTNKIDYLSSPLSPSKTSWGPVPSTLLSPCVLSAPR